MSTYIPALDAPATDFDAVIVYLCMSSNRTHDMTELHCAICDDQESYGQGVDL